MTWLYIWLGVTVLALIAEFITSEMVSIWFAGGAFVAMILAACGLSWHVHLPVFIFLSLLLMLCFRNLVIKKFNKEGEATNAETAIGKETRLLTAITPETPGSIKLGDVVWTAVCSDSSASVPADAIVKITDLKGNKYIVEEIK